MASCHSDKTLFVLIQRFGAATNPYATPQNLNSAGPGDARQVNTESATPSVLIPYLCAATFVSLISLTQYLALDFFVVRVRPYPQGAGHYDWTLILFPVLPTVFVFASKRIGILKLALGQCLSSILLGLILAIPLVGTLGVWFHFAIGGRL